MKRRTVKRVLWVLYRGFSWEHLIHFLMTEVGEVVDDKLSSCVRCVRFIFNVYFSGIGTLIRFLIKKKSLKIFGWCKHVHAERGCARFMHRDKW